jgi:hypothetical protein
VVVEHRWPFSGEIAMNRQLSRAFIAGFLLLHALCGYGQAEETRSCEPVQSLLARGTAPEDVVRAVVDTGMTLGEATVFAMVCGGEANRVAIATAGVSLAGNLAQAKSVANSVLATAGETGPVAGAVDAALQDYVKNMPQPSVYEDQYTPHGGGASPAT